MNGSTLQWLTCQSGVGILQLCYNLLDHHHIHDPPSTESLLHRTTIYKQIKINTIYFIDFLYRRKYKIHPFCCLLLSPEIYPGSLHVIPWRVFPKWQCPYPQLKYSLTITMTYSAPVNILPFVLAYVYL